MKFLAVVPARSGSKNIKRKNIYKINSKPLISYTFEQLNKSKLKKKFVLTDDKKIKSIAKKFNINTDYFRPKKFSKDRTSLSSTLLHFYKWLNKKKVNFDYLVILQPTSPLRNFYDINSAVKIVEKKNNI